MYEISQISYWKALWRGSHRAIFFTQGDQPQRLMVKLFKSRTLRRCLPSLSVSPLREGCWFSLWQAWLPLRFLVRSVPKSWELPRRGHTIGLSLSSCLYCLPTWWGSGSSPQVRSGLYLSQSEYWSANLSTTSIKLHYSLPQRATSCCKSPYWTFGTPLWL